jgi:hypothetical protein
LNKILFFIFLSGGFMACTTYRIYNNLEKPVRLEYKSSNPPKEQCLDSYFTKLKTKKGGLTNFSKNSQDSTVTYLFNLNPHKTLKFGAQMLRPFADTNKVTETFLLKYGVEDLRDTLFHGYNRVLSNRYDRMILKSEFKKEIFSSPLWTFYKLKDFKE